MNPLNTFLIAHWFSLLLLATALALGVRLYWVRTRPEGISFVLLRLAATLGLLGIGGLISALLAMTRLVEHPIPWALGAVGVALAVLFAMLLILLASSRWFAPLAYTMSAIVLLGLGAAGGKGITRGLNEAGKTILRLEVLQPWWLLLLALVPLIVFFSFHSLAGLGPVRRWLAIGLRCALVVFLTLALAEVRLRQSREDLTVLFLVDRSLSIPEEFDPNADARAPRGRVDLRWERVKKFINESVEKRATKSDRAGLIVFGRRPRLELPPSAVPKFNFEEVTSIIDNNYTDIGAAVKLALASFPEGTAKRIVLISDGNENLGNAEEQARIAKINDVRIDVVPLAAGARNENEVLVQSVEAPTVTEQSSQLPIRVLIRSDNPNIVEGLLSLRQVVDGQPTLVGDEPLRVRLRQGLNSIAFKHKVGKEQQSYTYEAIFQPERVLSADGEVLQAGLQGDRVQNNRATTHVIALGQRKILFVEPRLGEHRLLVDHLRRVGDSKFKVYPVTPDDLPQNKAELAVLLSNYDCVILANVPASDVAPGTVGEQVPGTITDEQQEVIHSNTYDQGCGLIMIGGPYSFGAGGWQGTPIERALPVDCDIKSVKIQGKGGLVLIMHASEIADGNRWQKEIAKLAIRKLSPVDMLGMIYYDGDHRWHIPFKMVGENHAALLRLVDKMSPGDMPDADPALEKSLAVLSDPANDLATRHIIFISDGDHWQINHPLLAKLKSNKITCTTVCVTSHGKQEEKKMSDVARATGGRFYSVKSPKALPAIYIKETRLVSQSFVYEKKFQPRFENIPGGPTEGLPAPLRPLYGFVRTTPKASVLVNKPIMGPPTGELEFPVLAYWHYGLGKVAAFTSDARSRDDRRTWDRDWADSDMYGKFWEQLVSWSVRAVESGRLSMATEYRDGKVRVIVDARDKGNRPLTDLVLRGGVTTPSAKTDAAGKLDLRFEQKNSGIYEAEFKAEEAGSYFIVAQPTRKLEAVKDGKKVEVLEGIDSIRSGVTIPYSPEFIDMESNTPLLERLREIAGGRTFADDPAELARAGQAGTVFRHDDLPRSRSLQPIWYWLLLATAVLLFFDVAVRRIAVDPSPAVAAGLRLWERLRNRPVHVEETPQYIDRLQSRKAQVGASLEKARAAQRFDAGAAPPAAPPPGAGEMPPSAPAPSPPRPTPIPPAADPAQSDEAADYASRLLRAKKKIWEKREKEKE